MQRPPRLLLNWRVFEAHGTPEWVVLCQALVLTGRLAKPWLTDLALVRPWTAVGVTNTGPR